VIIKACRSTIRFTLIYYIPHDHWFHKCPSEIHLCSHFKVVARQIFGQLMSYLFVRSVKCHWKNCDFSQIYPWFRQPFCECKTSGVPRMSHSYLQPRAHQKRQEIWPSQLQKQRWPAILRASVEKQSVNDFQDFCEHLSEVVVLLQILPVFYSFHRVESFSVQDLQRVLAMHLSGSTLQKVILSRFKQACVFSGGDFKWNSFLRLSTLLTNPPH